MKKIIAFLLTAFALVQTHAKADDNSVVFNTSLTSLEEGKEQQNKIFKLQANFDAVGRTKFREGCSDDLQFYQGELEGSFVFYADRCYEELALLSLSYTNTFFDWNHNPFFHQKHFNIFSVKLGASTHRLDRWYWVGELVANFDIDHFSDLNDYTNFDFLAWGRYTYCPNFGVHIGFLGYTGMKIDRVYPIVGFDYRLNSKWKFNAIFPVNISIVYTYNRCWSTYIGSRFIDVRYRVNKHSTLSKGLWAYRTVGAEVGLNYDYNSIINFNAHIGSTFGGRVKIANRHNHHSRRFRLNPAGYVGAQCDIRF